jgi:hypothetical protein
MMDLATEIKDNIFEYYEKGRGLRGEESSDEEEDEEYLAS